MKKLQQLGITGVLTLVLTTTTFAGHIHTPFLTQPPPPPDQPSVMTPGINTPGLQNSDGTSDSVADIALNLLQTMLAVF